MPRLHGVRERRHQPVWDTLIRTTGVPTTPVQPQTFMFGNANVGQLSLTNLQVAGQLASDQTYVILAMRAWLFFDGTNSRALYQGVTSQLYFTLSLGDKPQFSAPAWYYPAGGGVFGFDSTTPVYNHGLPGQSEILKLARPIIIPVRQNIQVSAQFFSVGSTNVVTLMNAGAADDQKVVLFMLDGLQTRDVQ
jgi:hypothetical protein